MSSSDRQPPAPYPTGFLLAVRPEDVNANECDHDLGICSCVHDWRIHWGNVKRQSAARTAVL